MQETNFKRDVLVDFIQMTILFLASVIAVYKVSPTFRDLFFFIPLILAFRSKKDYFWFAYFFILINAPASFFVNRFQDAIFRLPYYSIIPKFSLTPVDIFLFISIFKAIKTKVKVKFFLNKPLEFFLFYLLLVSIPVSFFLGTDFKGFINSFRSFFFYGIIFSYLRLITSKEQIIKFGYLTVPFTILIIFDQLFLLNTGNYFITLFDPSMLGFKVLNNLTMEVRAIMEGVLIVFYTLIFGFQISNIRKYEIFPGFANVPIFLAIACFFLSATRAWMMMGSIAIIGYIFLSAKGMKFTLQVSIIGVFLVAILISSGFIQQKSIDSIATRFGELGKMASSGNLKQGTFADRIQNDIPHVLKGLTNSPVLGVGLSRYMKRYYSSDVGFINTLLIYGIVGFPIFLFYLFRYMFFLNRYRKEPRFDPLEKNILISLLLGLCGMMIGYFFTWDFFSFFPEKVFFVSIIFATGDLVIEMNARGEGVEQ
jgi:hypothetical protein